MYQDLKQSYWWYGMKRDVAAHVALCDTCDRVKAKHQRITGLLQPLKVPEWKWEEIGEGPIRRPKRGGSEWEPIKILLEGD
jgi:hypothetical protein